MAVAGVEMVDVEVDVVIVGAGISGISMAYYIQQKFKNKKYLILDSRESIGGTWDLFQYPGIRSDSDMYTFGYAFHPWIRHESISEGEQILEYVQSAADTYHLTDHILFSHSVQTASWSSNLSQWTLEVLNKKTSLTSRYRSQFLLLCTGYYDHEQGYTPSFPGREDFKGLIIHPQKWPKDFCYANQQIVIIGSGATAVTLLPNLAKTAKHVTMLQRSPTYIASVTNERSSTEAFLYRFLPQNWAFQITRWYRIFRGIWLYNLARKYPKETIQAIKEGIYHFLGKDFNVEKHFTPQYAPWDQRFCICPDGDFFQAIAQKKASVVTDTIERFTENGIQISSGSSLSLSVSVSVSLDWFTGEVLPADVIITATGLNLKAVGGINFLIDNKPIRISDSLSYKGSSLDSSDTWYIDLIDLCSTLSLCRTQASCSVGSLI
jgi:monooxygenase